MSVHSAQVNDGEWHALTLEVDGNYAKLVLDRVHAASGTAPGTLRTLNLDNTVYFGGHVRQLAAARHGRSLPVTSGLRGCLEAIALNGQELPLNTKARRAHAALEDIVDVSPGCALAPAETCSSNPCTNGGSCTSLPNGGISHPSFNLLRWSFTRCSSVRGSLRMHICRGAFHGFRSASCKQV